MYLATEKQMLYALPDNLPVEFHDDNQRLVVTIRGCRPEIDLPVMVSLSEELLRNRAATMYAETIETEFVVKQIQDREWWSGIVFNSAFLTSGERHISHTLDLPGPVKVEVKGYTTRGLTLRVHYD